MLKNEGDGEEVVVDVVGMEKFEMNVLVIKMTVIKIVEIVNAHGESDL